MRLFYFNQGSRFEIWECTYVKYLLEELCHPNDPTRLKSILVRAQCNFRISDGLIKKKGRKESFKEKKDPNYRLSRGLVAITLTIWHFTPRFTHFVLDIVPKSYLFDFRLSSFLLWDSFGYYMSTLLVARYNCAAAIASSVYIILTEMTKYNVCMHIYEALLIRLSFCVWVLYDV